MSEQVHDDTGKIKQGKNKLIESAKVIERFGVKYFYSRHNRIGKDYESSSKENIWHHPDTEELFTLKEPAYFTEQGMPVFICIRGCPYSLPFIFSEKNQALMERDLSSFETKAMIYSQFKQGIFKPRKRIKLESIWTIIASIVVIATITSIIWVAVLGGLGIITLAT